MLKTKFNMLRSFLKSFLVFIKYTFITVLSFLIILFLILAPSFSEIKSLSENAIEAKDSLEGAISSVSSLDLQNAKLLSEKADKEFSTSLNLLEDVSSRKIFTSIPLFSSQLEQLKYLLRTGKLVSQSLVKTVGIVSDSSILLSEKLFSTDSKQFKKDLLQLAYESEPELIGLKASLELAMLDLEKINRFSLLYPVYNDLSLAKEELQTAIDLLDKTTLLSRVLPALGGYPNESNFLFVMHNHDELRPAGGFIGVYGLMKTKDGSFDNFLTYDSYHLDMPASISNNWNLAPPKPIAKYLGVKSWYLRDSNWSPDWPTSARKIQEIYHGEKKAIGESSEDFNAVISITPDFVSKLLDISGPITARGDVYTKENFRELLQYSVEVSYKEDEVSSWDRKDVINEIINELKESLFNISIEETYLLMNIINENIATKDIQIYFNDEYLQSLVVKLGAASELKDSLGDYLMVVDANLGAFKSDAVVRKSIAYEVNIDKDVVLGDLQLNYRHEGGFDWRTTRYRSYTRTYLPLGSSLNSVDAFAGVKIEKDSVVSYDDNDLNKTVIAFFFTLEPGSAGGINVSYQLPGYYSKLFKDNNYSLLVQKQSGRRTDSFDFSLSQEGRLKFEENYLNFNKDISIKL